MFESSRDGDDEIYVMKADSTAVTQLTAARGADDDHLPAWSDGMKIAFSSGSRPPNRRRGLVMYATAWDRLGWTNSSDEDWWPDWSPDGTKIAFTSDRDDNEEIYLKDSRGAGQVNASLHKGDDFAPDGTRRPAVLHERQEREHRADGRRRHLRSYGCPVHGRRGVSRMVAQRQEARVLFRPLRRTSRSTSRRLTELASGS